MLLKTKGGYAANFIELFPRLDNAQPLVAKLLKIKWKFNKRRQNE